MSAKVELILKIEGVQYGVNDLVSVTYSDDFVCSGSGVRMPTNPKTLKGKIVEIYDNCINIDYSTEYNSNKDNVYFENIMNISKFQ